MIIHFWKSAKTLGFSSMGGGGGRKRYDADRILLFWPMADWKSGFDPLYSMFPFTVLVFTAGKMSSSSFSFPFNISSLNISPRWKKPDVPDLSLTWALRLKSQCHKAFDFCFSIHQFPPGPVII
jgi:hypothetical protein